MNNTKQIKEIAKYFKTHETEKSQFKIGAEFEHFIVYKRNLETVNYFDKEGVQDTLKELEALGWQGKYEGQYLLGLSKGEHIITLEPGSQFELSIFPQDSIGEVEERYLEFLKDIVPILEKKNQCLMAVGYHPQSKIGDLRILPKKRYDYMFHYFKDKGSHAHNMMKGTAALQVALDYESEEDYIKKFRIANALGPVAFAMFDNSYYFEGEIWEKHNVRTLIWQNCDEDRSGVVKTTFDEDFGYEKYAQYILNGPPILVDDGEKVYFTGNKLTKEIWDPDNYSTQELEHILTMFFPDVRTKKYIEIRMMDSVPYPLNLAAIALWKGLLYNTNNINELYDFIKDFQLEDINRAKMDIIERGLDGKLGEKSIFEIGKWMVQLAKAGLGQEEVKYIQPLEDMINNKKTPRQITKEGAEQGKRQSLDWCILNNVIEVK